MISIDEVYLCAYAPSNGQRVKVEKSKSVKIFWNRSSCDSTLERKKKFAVYNEKDEVEKKTTFLALLFDSAVAFIHSWYILCLRQSHSFDSSFNHFLNHNANKKNHTHIRIYANNYACFQRSLILLIIIFLSDVHFALRNALHSHLTHSIHCDSRTTQMNRIRFINSHIISDMLWFFISSKHPKIYEMHAHSRFFFLYSHSEWLRF